MILSLKPGNLKRYKDVLHLLLKYGKADLFKDVDLDSIGGPPAVGPEAVEQARDLADDLEKLGPTYIKLGQLLSTRGDLLPAPLIESLARLTDHVEPVPVEQLLPILEEELQVKYTRLYPDFDLKPIAAASLGQVHRATLRDGRQVVVKIQRPGIRERIREDMEALGEIATFLDHHTEAGRKYGFRGILEEFRRTIFQELDYRQEARHLSTMAQNLAGFGRIFVPKPVDDLTTSRVLTMEYVAGVKVSLLEPLRRLELNGPELADQLFEAYLQQILVDGFVHADPHGGNVLVTDDNRLALIDLGMVIRLTPRLQDRLVSLLLAIGETKGEEAARAVLAVAASQEGADREGLTRRINDILGRAKDSKLEEMAMGRVVIEITRAAVDSGLRLPSEISMVGQTLLKLDSVGRQLDPGFRTHEAIRTHALKVMRGRMLRSESIGGFFSGLVELKEFVTQLPGRVNRILDVVADNRLRVEVDALDEDRLMEGLQKVANRITLGLVLAALIIGAALTLRIESAYQLFGYPALPMLLFLAAGAGGILLVLSILLRDVKGPPPGSGSGPESPTGAP